MNNNSKIFLAALAGAALGVIGGILVAPASGKETIEDLLDRADDLKDELEDIADKSKQQVNDFGDKVAQNISEAIKTASETIAKEKKA